MDDLKPDAKKRSDAEAIRFDNSYAALPDIFHVRTDPARSPAPAFIAVNDSLARELGIDPAFLHSEAGLAMLSGNAMPPGAEPVAMAYAGHQFGGFSPQLGDGRALLIGEVVSPAGERFDIQLKGSGRTVFSRNGDGKAAVGPVMREYIVSEAMAALGVPTSRALAAVTTGERVQRERGFPGGIVARVARSHVRVGTFQFFAARRDTQALQTLADYVIGRHYPKVRNAENPVRALFEAVCVRQANLIALWLKFGFIHGVMNTDNVQIAGETIDFGPCAFMDEFDPLKVFSSIDYQGRYAWARQPAIGRWNMARLAEALLPIWGKDEPEAVEEAKQSLDLFSTTFDAAFNAAFAQKLGLPGDWDGIGPFVQSTFDTMHANKADFTLFFSHLRRREKPGHSARFAALFASPVAAAEWLDGWEQARVRSGFGADLAQERMDAANPIFIPRNHRVEEAIAAGETGDFAPMRRLNEVLQRPFDEQPGAEEFEAAPTPEERVLQTFCGT
ncbi:MAG: YdiU family protein [Beijerinckiaceae bacterium]